MPAHGLGGIANRVEQTVRFLQAFGDVVEKVGQPPTRRLGCGGDAHPSQHFLGTIGFEISNIHTVAVWHGGFLGAEEQSDRVLQFLNGGDAN